MSFREIPYNYTSAGDEQIVKQLFGNLVWKALENLREQRVTGRSAKLLMRFIGDLFILHRNPYLMQELIDSPKRRSEHFKAAKSDLGAVEAGAQGNKRLLVVLRHCREALDRLEGEVTSAAARRDKVRRTLEAVVGGGNVCFDPFTLVSHATDATDWRLHLPLAVAFPHEETQVAPLLEAIASLGLKAIPRGAGTGLTGGAVPLAMDCVMVNTERLDRIRGIREAQVDDGKGHRRPIQVFEAEAGLVTDDAIRFCAKEGLVFATDPTSSWACTLGGNLAENAGGKTAVLWGTAVDNVLSWRMAMPGGKVLRVERAEHPMRKILPGDKVEFTITDEKDGKPLKTISLLGSDIRKPGLWKDVTRKTLKGLPGFQKEGTDGVITSAVFVLHKAYEHQATACLEFYGGDFDEAGRVIWDLSREFVNEGAETLLALEHFDAEYVRAIEYRRKAARPEDPVAVLLIDLVGHTEEQLAKGRARLEKVRRPYANTELFFAANAAEATEFWKDRKKLAAIAKRTNAFKLNEDTVLPLDRLAEFARYVDFVNTEEQRFNQLQFTVAAAESVAKDAGQEGQGFLEPKIPTAKRLCEETAKALKTASKNDLRQETYLRALREDLSRLFAGYAEVAQDLDRLYQEVRSRLIVIATHMHAGDGNVHVNIPVFSNDRDMMRRAAATADATMEKVKELGGVVSGEHGIGLTKLHHLERSERDSLAAYRGEVDPDGVMNPGKLSDPGIVDLVFTPSFNLLELEARILQHGSLEKLADMISKCVRCGKCKPNCCVFYPKRGMFYHPRNKNLAVAALIEALLYEVQRFHNTEFRSLKHLGEVADQCTLCHKCLAPCPVSIDTGKVSVLEREILAARGFKRTAPATRLSLGYLASRSRLYNPLFRSSVLVLGSWGQRMAHQVARLLPLPEAWRGTMPLAMIQNPMTPVPTRAMGAHLPKCGAKQALCFTPEIPNGRTVFYFPGCGSERMFSDIGLASLYLLAKTGTRVVIPPPYLCCGYPLHANAKTKVHDRLVLADTILFSQIREMFAYLDFDSVVVSCGTCREALEGMGAPDIFGAPLADISRFALENGLPAPPKTTYLYHQPCHDSLKEKAGQVLGKAGSKVVMVPHCCSEAGTLSLSRPDISGKMSERKGEALQAAMRWPGSPRCVVTNCPSCVQGLGRQSSALGLKVRHLAVELAEKTGGKGWREEARKILSKAEVVNF
jgi:FAD/FMN-containing dehydrogenase/Fe-S oxidoreductase